VSARESHAIKVSSKDWYSRRRWVRLPPGHVVSTGRRLQAGQVFQVTYRVPLEFITRVNGCYNDGATTLTNSTDPRFVRLCGEQPDTLLNRDVGRKHKAHKHLETTSICNPESCGEKTVINCMWAVERIRFYRLGDSGYGTVKVLHVC